MPSDTGRPERTAEPLVRIDVTCQCGDCGYIWTQTPQRGKSCPRCQDCATQASPVPKRAALAERLEHAATRSERIAADLLGGEAAWTGSGFHLAQAALLREAARLLKGPSE